MSPRPPLVCLWGCSWRGPLTRRCPRSSILGSSSWDEPSPVSGLLPPTGITAVRPARLMARLPHGSSGNATDAQARGGLGDLSAPATCIGPLPVPPRPAAPQVSGSLSRGLALSPRASHWASAHSAIMQLTITEPLAPLARQASSLGLSVPTWKMEAMNQGHGGVSLPTSCPLKRAWSQRN